MHRFILIAALTAFAGQAAAQDVTADSNSHSGAQSSIVREGTDIDRAAPGLGGIGGNSTAPCAIAQGFGIVGPGAGLQFGNARIDKSCLTRVEAAMLRDLLDMRPSPGRQAAIHHACANNKRLRETLVAMGACVVRGR